MTHDEDAQLVAWLGDSFDPAPVAALEKAFARTRLTSQRPAWIVNLTGGTIAERPASGLLRFSPVLAAVVLIGLLAGALIVGGLLPPPKPAPLPLVDTSASPQASAQPTPLAASGRIVFTRTTILPLGPEGCSGAVAVPINETCEASRIVVANQDGTNEHGLFPDGLPTQDVVAMSPDGSRFTVGGIFASDQDPHKVYLTGLKWYLTDLSGSTPQLLDTGCVAPCVADYGFAFSPDGGRLAFTRDYGTQTSPNVTEMTSTVVAIMDLSTGEVLTLESTRVVVPGGGYGAWPNWSPDGERLLFTRGLLATRVAKNPNWATFVVDANGANLRQLVPTELWARDAQWSPDGSLIVFTAAVETVTGDRWNQLNDIYTVRPDGTDLSRLTTDSAEPIAAAPGAYGARLPHWTSDGRIVFIRTPSSGSDPMAESRSPELWVMDADGANAMRLNPVDVSTLTALGCVVCPAPVDPLSASDTMAFWVPGS